MSIRRTDASAEALAKNDDRTIECLGATALYWDRKEQYQRGAFRFLRMARHLLPYLIIFTSSLNCMGQWSLGPSASLIGLSPTFPGLGISSAYALNTRTSLTLDATWYIPKTDGSSGIHVGDPTMFPTVDTSSFSWKSTSHSSFATALIGIQRTFNREKRTHEWFWKIAMGYGEGQDQHVSDYVGTYTGNAEPYELNLR